MNELTGNIRTNFIIDIDAGYATEVPAASFRQGDEDEIITRFYRLWGRVIRSVENRRSTVTKYFFVEGNNLALFNAYF